MRSYETMDAPAGSPLGSPALGGAVMMGKTPEIAGYFTQLGATVRRQFTQKRRMPCSMCVEILLPVVFALGIYLGSLADSITLKPADQFVVPYIPVVPGPNQSNSPSMLQTQDYTSNNYCYNGTNSRLLGSGSFLKNCSYALDPATTQWERLQQCNWGNNGNNFNPNDRLICTDAYADLHLPPGFCIYTSCATQLGRNGQGQSPTATWPLQETILMQWASAMIYGPITDAFGDGNGNGLRISGKLVLVPNTTLTQSIDAYFKSKYPLYEYIAGPLYSSYNDAVNYAISTAGEGKYWAIAQVYAADTTAGLSYSLSLNKSSIQWTNRVRNRFSGGGLGDQSYGKYVTSGFTTLEQIFSEYFMTQVIGMPDSAIHTFATVPMGYDKYRVSIFLQIAGNVLCQLFMVLAYLYPVSQLAKRVVEEKELRLREATMVMGLGKFALFSSWLVTYLIQGTISSAIITFILSLVLKQSQASVIFILFMLFTLSTILLACLLSTFFSKSKIVALVVPLLYFLLSIPSFALPQGTSRGTYLGLSIFSPTAFGIGIQLLFSYEIDRGFGYNDFTNPLDTVNMATAMGMLVFDSALYLLLTLYLDEVLPSEWGTKRHPLFFLPCFWESKPKEQQLPLAELSGGNMRPPLKDGVGRLEAIEHYPSSDLSHQSVHINHIRREFDSHGVVKVAVDDLEMRLFPNQITVLLGHNGAGKTTAINLLTGMLEMTSGDCLIYGKSVRSNLRGARAEIGFCPQHNVLWQGLTCFEHLQYFARLKGVPSSEIDQECHSMLEKMDLVEKKDSFSESLSGGQKRKLSVAIAMIGGSRLILLDEPTAGMDVGARRSTLNLLKEMAIGRTILITTHYMDEADALGNRIVIMSKGNLHSYGSPMFLKTKLGTGYVLRVSLPHADQHAGELLRTVRNIVPSAELKESKGGNEVAIQLPINETQKFSSAIGQMESPLTINKFGITGISLSVSTLEDVFLRIAREEDLGGTTNAAKEADEDAASVRKLDEHYSTHSLVREPTFLGQLHGLLLKRFRYSRRDRRTIALQILLPLACVALAMVLSKLGPPPSPPLRLDDSMYDGVAQQIPLCGCADITSSFSSSPYPVTFPAASVNQTFNFSNALVETYNFHGGFERNIGLSCYDPDYDNYLNRTNTGQPRNYTTLVMGFFNATSLHSLPQVMNQYYEAAANAFLGRTRTSANYLRMNVYNYPLPFSDRQQQSVAAIQALITGIFILIPFTFVPSTYVAFVVKERQCKAKHLQLVCGVGHTCYWVSNFLFDLVSYLVTELMAIVIFFIFSKNEYVGDGSTLAATIISFLLYGLSCIPAAYAFSFMFDDHSSAQNFAMLGNFFSGFVLVLAHYVLKLIPTTTDIASKIVWPFRMIPAFCLGESVITLAQAPSAKSLGKNVDIWSFDSGIAYPLLFLAGEVIVFFLLTLLLEVLRRPSIQDIKAALDNGSINNSVAAPPTKINPANGRLSLIEEDLDVVDERLQLERGDPSRADDVLTAMHLNKIYPDGKVAVRDVTFGVKRGEVFGFLGTNGAGKTTTMSILTSDLLPTRGLAKICGSDVVQDVIGAQRHIGFCPQFDALLDLLTAEEHLQLFASLRGIPANQTEFICSALMEACKLDRVSFAKNLSGGNRRKLSVAISLIGAPEVLLLDEPSAGMDPKTRRQLWDVVLVAVKHNSSIVLTTHHLEEVDALAHRVAIMVDGSLRCIGSVDHLKKKFGSGIEVMVKGHTMQDIPQLQAFMYATFPTASLLEDCNLRLTYRVPTEAQPPLSVVFATLEQAKSNRRIGMEDYTVQQTSLEQVFLRISGQGGGDQDRPLGEVAESVTPPFMPNKGYSTPAATPGNAPPHANFEFML